ncbi:beta-lactamase [Biomphalaria glabrata]|nr:beta-lactamase-like [Biomphalaria glabrata]KAI8777816.1 beta-lactamase [Biomphalaria glabrata]
MQSTKNKFVQASYVEDLSVFSADIKQRITDFAKILIACKGVPGITISIVKDDNIWLLPLGYRDLENKSPITEDTKFLIGSITKTFTAQLTAILIQESQEKISWDTPLKEIYRPNLVKTSDDFFKTITLRDLLSHRSGFVSGNLAVRASLPDNISRQDLIQLIHHVPVNTSSEKHFLYSNMGYTLVGSLLEHKWNQSWEHLIKEKLFGPLGMNHSSVVKTAEDFYSQDIAKPYIPVEGEIKNCDPIVYVLGPIAVAGDILSNAKDMSKWLQFVLRQGNAEADNQLISYHLMSSMWEANSHLDKHFLNKTEKSKINGWPKDDLNLGYGLGWFLNKYNGKMNYWHGGGLYSYYSLAWLFPETNLGFFISINGYKGCNEHDEKNEANCPCGSNGFTIIEPLAYFIADIFNDGQSWLNTTNVCKYPHPWTKCIDQKKIEIKNPQLHIKDNFNKEQNLQEMNTLKLNTKSLQMFLGTYTNPLLGDSHITIDTKSSKLYFQLRLLTGFLHHQPDETGLSFWLECDKRYRFLSKPDNLSYVPVKKTFILKFNVKYHQIDSVHIYFAVNEAPFIYKKKS